MAAGSRVDEPAGAGPSLILAAHGSLAHATSNQPLFDLADRISKRYPFPRVTPAFLNGEPNATNVLANVPEGPVVVVPVMTSHGYYLQNVLPAKLAENPEFDQYAIRVTPALGLHPRVGPLVVSRISRVFADYALSTGDTAIVLVGHGTKRNPRSAESTYALASEIRRLLANLDLHVAFLDQDPNLESLAPNLNATNVLIIPFLISRGPHTTVDVPGAFGLPTGPEIEFPLVQQNPEGRVICDLPVGMYPEMAELCIELATATAKLNEIRQTPQRIEASP